MALYTGLGHSRFFNAGCDTGQRRVWRHTMEPRYTKYLCVTQSPPAYLTYRCVLNGLFCWGTFWAMAEAQSPRPFESIADAYAGMPHYQPSSDYVVPAFRQSRKDRMKVPPRPHPSLALTLPYLTPNLTSPYP
eukprot:1054921-Prorocentrum_minimum.AAC.1